MNEIEMAEIGLARLERWFRMADSNQERPKSPPAATHPLPTKNAPVPAESPDDMDLAQLAAACSGCRKCALSERRTQAVFGTGSTSKNGILFVGEGPGEQEDLKGEPFVGPAGRLLTAMLAAIGIDRSQVYITNAVKCRPPQNRTPGEQEVAACMPYLQNQIRLLAPRLIVALGRTAANALLGTHDCRMADLRGRIHACNGIDLLITYHPSYYLHQPQRKIEGWKDLVRIRQLASR